MDLANFRILIHELLNKDPDTVPEEDPLVLLDKKYSICMYKNGKETKHTRILRIHFIKTGEKCKVKKIDWCEGDLQLSETSTNNVGEHDISPRIKYIMVILEN